MGTVPLGGFPSLLSKQRVRAVGQEVNDGVVRSAGNVVPEAGRLPGEIILSAFWAPRCGA